MSKKKNNKNQKEKTEQSSSPKRLLIPFSHSAEEALAAVKEHFLKEEKSEIVFVPKHQKVKSEVESEQSGEEMQVVFSKQPRSSSKIKTKRGAKSFVIPKWLVITLGILFTLLLTPSHNIWIAFIVGLLILLLFRADKNLQDEFGKNRYLGRGERILLYTAIFFLVLLPLAFAIQKYTNAELLSRDTYRTIQNIQFGCVYNLCEFGG